MANRKKKFESCLHDFPEEVRPHLRSAVSQMGRLTAAQCTQLKEKLSLNAEELAIRLLPLAKCFAVAPVSGFKVGAIALAGRKGRSDRIDLFFGSNLEFLQVPLNQSIHAEQSAALNAWHQGAGHLHAIAASETPCGYCRQFLNEFEQASGMYIIRPSKSARAYKRVPLSALLPDAFGPQDLRRQAGLLQSAVPENEITVEIPAGDRVAAAALAATLKSYAPYSNNSAGCAIQTVKGEIFSGRCVETAAYNPSLTPLQTAIMQLNAATLADATDIKRVVLIEKRTAVSQRRCIEMLIEAWEADIALEYYEAK